MRKRDTLLHHRQYVKKEKREEKQTIKQKGSTTMITDRQRSLLDLLRENEDTYISQYEISQRLPNCYFYNEAPDKFHDSQARYRMTADIRSINGDAAVESIILSNSNGVKIANQEEFERGMKAEFASIFRRLKRAYEKARKGAKDGQFKYTDENGDWVIEESKIFSNKVGDVERERGET